MASWTSILIQNAGSQSWDRAQSSTYFTCALFFAVNKPQNLSKSWIISHTVFESYSRSSRLFYLNNITLNWEAPVGCSYVTICVFFSHFRFSNLTFSDLNKENVQIIATIIKYCNDSNPLVSFIYVGNIFIRFNSSKVALFEGGLFFDWVNLTSSLPSCMENS